jgi:uncharacterized protein YqgC (DUF456 family)
MEALLEDVTVICGLAIAVGVIGTVLPVLPGALLIGGAVAVWALVAQTTAGWLVLGAVLVLLAVGQVLKYLTAGRTMTSSGVPRRSLIIAGLAGIVGFFVIPVVGLAIGFVGALYLAERARLGAGPGSRRSTVVALKAVGIAIAVELTSALLAAVTWLLAVLNGAGG